MPHFSRLEDEADAIIGLVKIHRHTSRHMYTRHSKLSLLQKNVLYSVFTVSFFPSVKNKKDLGYLLGMSFESVDIWFKKMRKCVKSSSLEIKKISSSEILSIYINENGKLN
ncbi:homeobox domain-containing protein 15 [Vairimorpha necatrix]|uniref:Homeobox domain-containing protein 15 n=1 Tax=Vairimorpha necatrix TaxID=6039 RepID=A0AAX4JD31_9MICR